MFGPGEYTPHKTTKKRKRPGRGRVSSSRAHTTPRPKPTPAPKPKRSRRSATTAKPSRGDRATAAAAARAAAKAVKLSHASRPIETLAKAEAKIARTADRKERAALRKSAAALRHALAADARYKASLKTPEGSPDKHNFPLKALKDVAPSAYERALKLAQAGGHGSSRGLGEPEDLTTAITLAAPGGGFAGALGKRALEVGGKDVAKELGDYAAGRVEAAGGKATLKAVKAGSAVKAGGRLAGNLARKAAGKETVKATESAARKAAEKAIARGESRASAAAVPGLKLGKITLGQSLPVVRGHEEALVHNPKKTLKTTARAIPGLVTVPVATAIKAGVTTGRAASEVAHEAGIPGAAGYSGEEILAPVKHIPAEQLAFAKQVAKVVTASDSKMVRKEVEDNLGLLLPITAALGTEALTSKLGKGKIINGVRKIAEQARSRTGRAHGGRGTKPPLLLERTHQRKGAALAVAKGRNRLHVELGDRQQPILKAARGATDGEVVRKGVGVGKRGKKVDLKIREADIASFLQRHPMPRDQAAALAEVRRIKSRLKEPPKGMKLAEDELHTRDVIDFIERHPDVLSNPAVHEVVAAYRRQGKAAREDRAIAPEHSERARFLSAATTRDIPFPEERPPRSVRDISRMTPKRGELAKDVLRREAREDHVQAKKLRRSAKALVKQAERRVEGARRRTLRAKVSEAGTKGEAAVRVSDADRRLLRREPDYVKAVRAHNKALKELRTVERAYRNHTNGPNLYKDGELTAKSKMVTNAVRVATRRAEATRKELGTVKARVLKRADVEISKAGRGDKATALAQLGRGPVGVLSRLEDRGGRVLQAAEHQAKLEGELVTARDLAKGHAADAKALAKGAARKHNAASEVDPSLTAEFAKEVEDRLRAEGIPDSHFPEYQHVGPGRSHGAPVYGSSGSKLTEFPGASKKRAGTAEEYGLAEEGLRPLIRESIARPVARRESYKAAKSVIEHNRFEPGGKKEWTAAEADELFAGSNPVLSSKQWMKVPRQFYKRIYDVLEGKGPGKGINAADFKMVAELEQLKGKGGVKGSHYMIVRKAAMDELVSQLSNTLVAPKIAKVNRATSFLILGTSPAWAAMQVVAEFGQSGVADARVLNPAFVKKALGAYKKMDPAKRQAFDSWVGVTNRTIQRAEDLKLDLKAGDMDAAANAYSTLEATPYGRFIRGIPTAISHVDQWKGGKIRALTALAKIDRDLNGHVNKFVHGIGGLDRDMRLAMEQMKGKPLHEQANWVAEHPKWAAHYQSYLDDVMGNWSALTKNERVAAQAMIFYPFMRMSLRWTFYSFPKRHPIKAAILYGLGQQNAQEVHKLLHGDPSYFTQWAMVPLDLGGEKKLVDLSRIAPGSNALVEALGGSGEGPKGIAAAKIAQPALAALGTAIYGVSPLSGKQEAGSGWNALAQLLSLSPVSRVAGEATIPAGRKKGEGAGQLPIVGSFSTERQEALDKLSAKLREYDTATRYVRTLGIPPLPKDVGKERDSAMLGRVLGSLHKNGTSAREDVASAYADQMKNAIEEGHRKKVAPLKKQRDARLTQMEDEYTEADKILGNLFDRYGIDHEKEDRLFLQFYEEGKYFDPEANDNPWSGSAYGGANPWSSSSSSSSSSNPWASK